MPVRQCSVYKSFCLDDPDSFSREVGGHRLHSLLPTAAFTLRKTCSSPTVLFGCGSHTRPNRFAWLSLAKIRAVKEHAKADRDPVHISCQAPQKITVGTAEHGQCRQKGIRSDLYVNTNFE